MKIAAKTEGGQRELVEVTCEHSLDYEVTEPALLESLKEQDFADFARLNGLYNAWPFIREFFVNISSRMPLPDRVVLPTLLPEMVAIAEQRAWGDFTHFDLDGSKSDAVS
jgi:hypothetical protein